MKTYQTPPGHAGSDQVNAMEESVNAHLEQIFHQVAKRNALDYGVGRTTMDFGEADSTLRLDAQKRECEGSIAFHAGRALELALHIVYARGADRILGREYPGVPKAQINEDRKSHSLAEIHLRIVEDLTGRNMADALEDVYQHALHEGVADLFVDEKFVRSVRLIDDTPFRVKKIRKMVGGAEMTVDHSLTPFGMPPGPRDEMSDFREMPEETFEDFLKKADSVYYSGDISKKRKNIRWEHYSARDHEYGRSYVVIGTKFFARLVRGIISLTHQRWMWDEGFARRQCERHLYLVKKRMKGLADQNFREEINLPEMISIDEWLKRYTAMGGPPKKSSKHDYDFLHAKWRISPKSRTGSA